jgi:arylsulfatase
MKELGIVDADWPLSPRPANVPAWTELTAEDQDRQDLLMAAAAGMIDRVDQNIGRLFTHLKKLDEYDNTLFLFLSDNGACPFQRTTKKTLDENLMPWDPESYWTYDERWAHACNTPFREYKRDQHEGGISTPLIAHWPHGIKTAGGVTHQPGHLVDIMATCLDLAGVEYPPSYNGTPIGPPRGKTLAPIFAGQQREPHDAILFTFYGTHNALRAGQWKLVNKDNGEWELYNLEKDRTELNDLAQAEPAKLSELKKRWSELAKEVGGVKRQSGKSKKKKTSQE